MEQKTYSNPRMEAIISNWPFGGKRATAYFQIDQVLTKIGCHKERGTRFLTLSGRQFATKKLTYAHKARIVDGSDGRTYILELTHSGFISVMRGDMKICEESIFDTDARFEGLKQLFDDLDINDPDFDPTRTEKNYLT